MSYCSGCGTATVGGAKFCRGCGQSLVTGAETAVGTLPLPGGERALTPSALMYLFGDRFAPRGNALTQDVPVPCKEVKVQMKKLATAQFAAAFWSLREQGLVALALYQKKGFLRTSTRVRVRSLNVAERPGLEGAVLSALPSGGEDTLQDVVYRWYGSDRLNPWQMALEVAIEESVAHGYVERASVGLGGAVMNLLSFGKHLTPRCERIVALEGEANNLSSRWESFRASEADLYKTLLDECTDAIALRLERRD